MPRKCTTLGCKTGYSTCKDKYAIFAFPNDFEEKKQWISAMPDDLKVEDISKYMGLCAKHFPNAKMKKSRKGKCLVPDEPPTYFPDASSPGAVKTKIFRQTGVKNKKPPPSAEETDPFFHVNNQFLIDSFVEQMDQSQKTSYHGQTSIPLVSKSTILF